MTWVTLPEYLTTEGVFTMNVAAARKQYLSFTENLHPYRWVLVAEDLDYAASVAYRQRALGGRRVFYHDADQVIGSWDCLDRPIFLLCGLALENTLKAFYVAENLDIFSSKQDELPHAMKTHKLVDLANRLRSLPWPRRSVDFLRLYEEPVLSWGRYPVANKAKFQVEPRQMTPPVWARYRQFMRRYGDRLAILLERKRRWLGEWSAMRFNEVFFDNR